MDFMKKVSELSHKVAETTSKAYNDVAGKTGSLIEESKTKASIKDKEAEIKGILEAMGKTVYQKYTNKEAIDEDFSSECQKIDTLNLEIKELQKKVLLGKNLRNCINCGETIPVSSSFCEKCGSKQDPVEVKEESKEEKVEEEASKEEKDTIVCPQCGNILKSDAKFCGKCGYKF